MRIKSDRLHSVLVGIASELVTGNRYIVDGKWNGERRACISFDCDLASDMGACKRITVMLSETETPTSFAIIGYLARTFPWVVDGLIADGHEIVNHTISHPSNFRSLPIENMRREIEGFQELMLRNHNYKPIGFRSPHGLRRESDDLFAILEKNGMYDSSLVGWGTILKKGIIEIPLTPCPEHHTLAFDSYHNFRFPLVCSSEAKVLKLWHGLTEKRNFINIFLDPLDLITETRLTLLRNMIADAKAKGFVFSQMRQIHAGIKIGGNYFD